MLSQSRGQQMELNAGLIGFRRRRKQNIIAIQVLILMQIRAVNEIHELRQIKLCL